MRWRHRILLNGIAAMIFGAVLMSVTVSRIYWNSPIYFYRYTTHPFTALGIFLCSIGSILVLMYIVIRLWEHLKARKAAQRKAEADRVAAAKKAEAESQAKDQSEPAPTEQ